MNNFSRSFVVSAVVACFFAFITPASAQTVIWHTGHFYVATSTIWHTGEIHAVTDNSILEIGPGKSLSIEPGVIVKMGYNSDIRVYGGLYATGTADNMIQFISLRDDTVGGDTNGDGNATSASYDDWRIIQVSGLSDKSIGNLDLNFVTIKHVNQSIIFASRANRIKISNCNIIDNLGSIFATSGTKEVSINHSNIYNPDYCDNASSTDPCHWNNTVRVYPSPVVDLTDNYWGSLDGPTYTTGTFPEVFKGVVLANLTGKPITYSPFASEPIQFGAEKRHPVIVIPGILGSWPDAWSDQWLMDPILHTYDDLLAALRLAGYDDGNTLFTFPYDWFKSNTITAGLLKDKIMAAKASCVPSDTFDCSKVDLVAHSMGGLVARAYIEGADYQNDVDQMIFVAVPQKGSPDSYLTWEGGDVNKSQFRNALYKTLLQGKAEIEGYKSHTFYDGVMYYVREKVASVRELLPIYDYLRDRDTGILRTYPDNYPVNDFLENLNTSQNILKLSQVRITNILGDNGESTINSLRVIPPLIYPLDGKWEHGIPENYNLTFTDRGLELGAGDDTVPEISSANFNNAGDIRISDAGHLSVVSKAQREIIKELTGQEPNQTITSTIVDHLLVFQIFSPADFQIIAPDGKRLGRDASSTSPLFEIPGGYYTGFSNSSTPEMAIIANPMEGDYRIGLIGTGNGGEYRMSVSAIDGATSTESGFTGQILADQSRSISVAYSPVSSTLGRLDPNITIESAISDVSAVSGRGLLTDKNAERKLIQQYELLKLRLEILDKLDVLAEKNTDKWQQKRQDTVNDILDGQNARILKLLSDGVLNQAGYDIIKANDDYLINN